MINTLNSAVYIGKRCVALLEQCSNYKNSKQVTIHLKNKKKVDL